MCLHGKTQVHLSLEPQEPIHGWALHVQREIRHRFCLRGTHGCCARNGQKRGDDHQLARTREGFLRVVAFNLRARQKEGSRDNHLSHGYSCALPVPFYRHSVISPTHQAYKVCAIISILEMRRLRVSSLWYQFTLQPPLHPAAPDKAAISTHSQPSSCGSCCFLLLHTDVIKIKPWGRTFFPELSVPIYVMRGAQNPSHIL